MSKRAREIIAIVMLVVLILGAMGVAGWYFSQSRHWNVAATTLDETLGGMDEYTIIAYEGILAVPEGSSTGVPLAANWDAFLDDQNRGNTSRLPSWLSFLEQEEEEPPTIKEVVAAYEDKGADVIIVDFNDKTAYRSPMVVQRGAKRVGIVRFYLGDSARRMEMYTKLLYAMKLDYAIAVVNQPSTVAQVSDYYDIVICTTDQGIPEDGTFKGSTLYVQVPTVGYVGTISVAPSSVASVKTVTSL